MRKHFYKFFVAILVTFFMFGCASQQNKDPLEGLNRSVYKFNDVVDKVALKPVAQGYQAITPSPIQTGVNNFFKNIRDVVTLVNELFQFKFKQAANTTGRVAVNTTVGVLGIFDVHSKSGGVRTKEDFGQTLGYYGFDSGAYL
ncbi:MAG: VacJ family lipoprotein, partial [Betaproteobacteria bacterium]|nr:VacJ family lipoprotein [Betaproteobacteria bacterium]